MKSFLMSVFVLLAIVSGASAQAKTIVISDIDDTLKISHVLDRYDVLEYSLLTDNVFGGMSTLFRALEKQDSTLKFYYVSNAPTSLMQVAHEEFVSNNNFPAGPVLLRESFFQTDFKVTEIRKIIEDENPDVVILVGDNGEKDSEVYAQVRFERPGIRFLTYIHRDYSGSLAKPLMPNQVEFVTSWDLLLHLRSEGFVSHDFSLDFLNKFALTYMKESEDQRYGNLIVPVWLDCRDFTWTVPDADFNLLVAHNLVKQKILSRCSP
jgi:hypothetical protein